MAITPVLVPHDNFSGRSLTRFGVGELINLSFSADPKATASELGGLRWFITNGGGILTNTSANDGQGLFTAPPSAGTVTIALKFMPGGNPGAVAATVTIPIVEPIDGRMERVPRSGVLHVNGTWSCAFLGEVFLSPTDVSFANILMREGSVAAVATGYLSNLNGQIHPAGPLSSVGSGDSSLGCKVNIVEDKVVTGILPPPFSPGDFVWDIPWEFSVSGSPLKAFTTARHHATADGTGQATISKKGAGPFSRLASDPTVGF